MNQNMMNENTAGNICPGCPSRCPKEALQCGKGRRYFERYGDVDEEDECAGRGRHGEHAKDGECTEQSQEKCREPLTLDERLVRQLRACMHYFHYGMGRKSGQQRILSLLRERRGMTQRELQDVLGVQPGSLSEILNKVEAGGYIRRRQNERDRRRFDLELTEAGENAARDVREEHRQMIANMFSALSEEEKRQLSQLLEKMTESWPHPDEAGRRHGECRGGFGSHGGEGRGGFGPHGGEGRGEFGPHGGEGRGRFAHHGGETPEGRFMERKRGPKGGLE